nr:hypothetical protein [Tanacetum cinerariifolium]
MSTIKFAETHNLVAFLKKPTENEEKIIVTEASIRTDLLLQDTEGTACLPNDTIFEELARMGRIQRNETEVPYTKPQTEESVPITSNDLLPSVEDRMQLTKLMNLCTNLQKQVLDLEKSKTAQAKEIVDLKKRVKKLERKKKSRILGLKRLWKIGSTARGRMNEEEMFRVNDFDGDEVIMDATADEEVEQSTKAAEKEVSTADPVTTGGEAKDKGKGIMVEPEKPLKKKDQIAFDEEVARKLEAQMKAEMEEEERIAREKDEANIVVIEQLDEVQAKTDADKELDQKL